MYKAYKFRMYPDDNQKNLIHKTFGCVRFIYNYFLNKCNLNGYMKSFDMCKEVKDLIIEYPFLKEVDSCALRCAIFNLEDAFKNYFSKRTNYPTFKSKFNKQAYRTNCIRSNYKGKDYSNIIIFKECNKIKLPKLGLVKIRGYRSLEKIDGNIINATITKETTGKYYVSVIVEEKEIIKSKVEPKSIIGIDLGVKDLVVCSDGKKYSNPKELLKREKRLKRLQKKLSRQIKGSKNYNKTKLKIARVHFKIKNSRKHNIIDIVNDIVKNNDCIISEKLNIRNMVKNHHLAKSIVDASFNKICELIKWKAKIYGKYYYQVDTYYPSSKTCSVCGCKTNKTNDLSVRAWKCTNCMSQLDRDINASINIMFKGMQMHYKKMQI